MSSLDTAVTLASTSSFSSPNPQLSTPPPSHTSLHQVPDVFVIPPEEEHEENPPFCYFDAAMESKRDLCTTPDIDALDVALGFYQQSEGNPAPMFHRSFGNESQDTVIMPRRSEGRFQDFPLPAVPRSSSRGVLDSDVIEVMKVRRSEGASNTPDEQRTYNLKKSRTFRARATQAFRSIKNVGKSNRRAGLPETWSATGGRENMAPGPTEDGVLPVPSTPNLVRKKSIQLSQIFTTSRSRSHTPDVPISPISPTASEWSAVSRPSLSIQNSPYIIPSPVSMEAPALNKNRSFVRRISVLDLHKLFSPSTPTSSKPPPLPVVSHDHISPSASRSPPKRGSMPILGATSSGFASIDDVFSTASTNSLPHLFHASRTESSLPSGPALDEINDAADTSLELQLDSLHFDSLHFDPDEFE